MAQAHAWRLVWRHVWQHAWHIAHAAHTRRPVRCRWVDPQGEAHRYGCVAAGGRASQQTYATHVWEVRPTEGRGKPARYRAGDTEGSCDVAADCFGMPGAPSKGQSAQGG